MRALWNHYRHSWRLATRRHSTDKIWLDRGKEEEEEEEVRTAWRSSGPGESYLLLTYRSDLIKVRCVGVFSRLG